MPGYHPLTQLHYGTRQLTSDRVPESMGSILFTGLFSPECGCCSVGREDPQVGQQLQEPLTRRHCFGLIPLPGVMLRV